MANTTLLRQVADYIEQHPRDYTFDWNKCVAGTTVRLDGGEFSNPYDVAMLVPNDDDPSEHVRDAWMTGFRYVLVRDRASRLLDINTWQATQLFMDLPGVADKNNPNEVVTFVRNYADYLDAEGFDTHYLDWLQDQR